MTMDYTTASEALVLTRARELVDRTLRQLYPHQLRSRRGKGAFGQLVEELHFNYTVNSDQRRDFPQAGLELKATGVVPGVGHTWRAKERLVLSIINYERLPSEAEFSTSAFYEKNARLLLVVYEWQVGVDPGDLMVNLVHVLDLDELAPADRKIIGDDWRTIQRYVLEGKAHQLSEGLTNYLSAARKGAGRGRDLRSQPFSVFRAPQRAYSLKQSFLTRVLAEAYDAQARERSLARAAPLLALADIDAGRTLEETVALRLAPFVGRDVGSIHREVAPDLNTGAKGFYATLVRRMLGVTTRSIDEFEKADVTMKVVRLRSDGRPRESISFPAFRYRHLAHQTWRTSDLRAELTRRFLFVFFREAGGALVFERATFWSMPPTTLDGEARRVWVETVRRVRAGRAGSLPGQAFSGVVHVRPHARNAADRDVTPQGQLVVKKSFWLNASYVAEVYRSTAPAQDG